MAIDSFENQEAARYVPSAMAINDFCRDIHTINKYSSNNSPRGFSATREAGPGTECVQLGVRGNS